MLKSLIKKNLNFTYFNKVFKKNLFFSSKIKTKDESVKLAEINDDQSTINNIQVKSNDNINNKNLYTERNTLLDVNSLNDQLQQFQKSISKFISPSFIKQSNYLKKLDNTKDNILNRSTLEEILNIASKLVNNISNEPSFINQLQSNLKDLALYLTNLKIYPAKEFNFNSLTSDKQKLITELKIFENLIEKIQYETFENKQLTNLLPFILDISKLFRNKAVIHERLATDLTSRIDRFDIYNETKQQTEERENLEKQLAFVLKSQILFEENLSVNLLNRIITYKDLVLYNASVEDLLLVVVSTLNKNNFNLILNSNEDNHLIKQFLVSYFSSYGLLKNISENIYIDIVDNFIKACLTIQDTEVIKTIQPFINELFYNGIF